MEVRPVGALLYHERGQTAGQAVETKLTVAFRNFANAPKNSYLHFASFFYKKKKKKNTHTHTHRKGGGGNIGFVHLQAATSLCRNRGPVIEITSHELTGMDFVMESV